MLHILGLEQPKKIFGHPWLITSSGKMSKSKGNTLYADDLVDKFGVDELRYYLLHEIPYSSDGILNYELLIERTNSDLANILGNLVNRTISMSKKYFDGNVVNAKVSEDIDEEFINFVLAQKDLVTKDMDNIRVSDALEKIMVIYRKANKYIDETTPWVLAKDETKQDRLKTVLYNLLEAIRQATVLLSAFLPDAADEIFKQINTNVKSFESLNEFGNLEEGTVGEPSPIFLRIDKEKKLEELQ
jgi:methionyl-tRNA synthetase